MAFKSVARRVFVLMVLVMAMLALGGCDVMQARYNAVTEQQRAKQATAAAASAEAYAQAEAARSRALETQAIQASAQVAQVEASNRLMAFLATLSTTAAPISDALLVGIIVVGAIGIVGMLLMARGR